MKRLLVHCAIALPLLTGTAFADTFTGVVSDAMCSKNAACARKCIDGGSPAVLIVKGKVLTVSNPDTLKPYAGKTVTVDGTLAEGTLTVKSVK